MSDSPFDVCTTEAEIMKKIFELSAQDKYSRPELLSLSSKRREELKGMRSSTLVMQKIIIPEQISPSVNTNVVESLVIIDDPKTSPSISFTKEGKYIL